MDQNHQRKPRGEAKRVAGWNHFHMSSPVSIRCDPLKQCAIHPVRLPAPVCLPPGSPVSTCRRPTPGYA
jgi:hypothetical protein